MALAAVAGWVLMLRSIKTRECKTKVSPQDLIQETPRIYKDLPVGLCYLDTDLRFIQINGWLAEINGIPAEEHLGRTIGELIPDVAAGVEAQYRQVIDTGEPIIGGTVEAETSAQPGIKRLFQHSYYPVRSDDGEVIGISCVVEDVTVRNEALAALRQAHDELEHRVRERTVDLEREIAEHERTGAKLRESEERVRAVLDNVADGVVTIDEKGRVQSFNPAAEGAFGYTADEVMGRNVRMLMAESDRRRHGGYIRNYLKTGKGKILGIAPREVTGRRKDGSTLPLELSVSEMFVGGKRVFIGAMRDITRRKQAEERIRQHEAELALVLRRGTLGEMASALAHELNQPLASVSTFSDVCLRKFRSGEWQSGEFESTLTEIQEQADRAGKIMRRIRQFVQKLEPAASPAHVNDIVDEAIKLVASELRSNNVELTLEPEAGLPRVLVDRIEIEQVVLNLVRNSIEAMTEIEAGKRRLRIRTSKAGKNLVEVVVIDSGAGLPTELADKAFDPFFSTKPGGMGMGLPICRTIVEAHGGRISARQDAGPGAAICFTLPTNGEDRRLVA